MKITRNQFLKLIPAAALTLTGCGSKAQPANTESLVFSHHYKLDYAQQFTADCYEGGYTMLTIAESDARFLVVPEDAAEVDGLPADVTVLRQPVENIYLVSTSVMDLLLHLDALDSVAFSGTKAEGWYLPEVKQAMEEGKIAYAGKYSAPDYEQILAAGCRLAIENTMILHTPEVKEQLEHFGIPVLVERSSYESDRWPAWSGSSFTASCWAGKNRPSRCFPRRRQPFSPSSRRNPREKAVPSSR